MATWNEYEVDRSDGTVETGIIAHQMRWARDDNHEPVAVFYPRSEFESEPGEGRRPDAVRVTVTARDVPAP